MDKEIFTQLAAPFKPSDIEWRAGATNADKTKALALAYITARAVMDRLDQVIGPENWRDEYASGPDGGVICGLSLRIDGEWITKWDGAVNTEFEAVKGGLSDAFKRVGYKWGIGRYLYKLDSVWVPCEVRGKTVVLKNIPELPTWALPDEWQDPSGRVVSKRSSEREREILTSLGFPNPKAEKVSGVGSSPPAAVSDIRKPLSGVGNGKNGSRSWNANIVDAILKAGLAAGPVEAVGLLNTSNLSPTATPEAAVAWVQNKQN